MPSIVIDVRREYSIEEEQALIDAAGSALVAAFGVPASTVNVVLQVHQPHRFRCPAGKSSPSHFTNVSIFALKGRSLRAKRALYQALADGFAELGIPRDCLLIKLHELASENVATRGAQPLCDVELGYEIDV